MKMVSVSEVIIGLALLQTFIEMAPMKIHCPPDNYIIVDSDGNKQGCFHCHNCHEGSGLSPPCGIKITEQEKKLIRCDSCVAGSTFSDKYAPSSCKSCHICHEKEIVQRKCTVSKDTICTGKCVKGYYYDNLTTHGCEKCSQCCNDKKDIRMIECNDMPNNRQCSILRAQECQPKKFTKKTTPSIPPYKDRTPNPIKIQSNGGLTTNEIFGIVFGVIGGLSIIFIGVECVCFLWRRRHSQLSSTSESSPPESVPLTSWPCSTCAEVNNLQSLCLQVEPEGEIRKGQAVAISCSLDSLNQQDLEFSWKKDGKKIEQNESALNIRDIKFVDFGNYTCHVRCTKTQSCSSSSSGEVFVDVLPCEGITYRRIDDLCRDSEVQEELVWALANDIWKPVARDFVKMEKRKVDFLEAVARDGRKKESAQETLDFMFTSHPSKTVYDLLKFLKKHGDIQDEELIDFLSKEEYLQNLEHTGLPTKETLRRESDNQEKSEEVRKERPPLNRSISTTSYETAM